VIAFVICHLIFVICASAQAMVFEDTTTQTKMYLVPNSGSHIGLKSSDSSINIRDIKGYPFGGSFTDAATGTRIEPGFGSFTGTRGAEPQPTTLTEGPVILNISRVDDKPGSDIKITWQINPLFYSPTINANTAVDIYFMTGKGSGEYESLSFKDLIISNNIFNPNLASSVTPDITNKYFIFKNQVGAGAPEIYFKGLLTGANPQAIDFTGLGAAVAVGKVLVTASGDRNYNMIGVPMIQAPNSTFFNVFSNAISQNGVEVYKFDNVSGGYVPAINSGAWDREDIILSCGEAAWIYNPLDHDLVLTIIGKVPPVVDGASIAPVTIYGSKKYNMISNPYPRYGTLSAIGLEPLSGSEIYYFDNKAHAYVPALSDGKAWDNDIIIRAGSAMWYYKTGDDLPWQTTVK